MATLSMVLHRPTNRCGKNKAIFGPAGSALRMWLAGDNINHRCLHENTPRWGFHLVHMYMYLPYLRTSLWHQFFLWCHRFLHRSTHEFQEGLYANKSTWIKTTTCLEASFPMNPANCTCKCCAILVTQWHHRRKARHDKSLNRKWLKVTVFTQWRSHTFYM